MHKILNLIAKISREGSKAPQWVLLFKAGLGTLADGVEFLVDETAFKLTQAFIAARGNEIHWDYEHQSVQSVEAPAAGWIKELAWEDGVGIKAKVEWTERAEQYIAKKEYRYFSPVFGIRKSDKRVCYLDSVALTNRPLTNNLTPILAKLEAKLETEFNKEEPMNREQLIAALGLKDDATDAEILAACAKAGVKVPGDKTIEVIPDKIIAALGLKQDDDVSTIVANILALKQSKESGVSREEFNKLQAELADQKATKAVEAAMKAGKVTPDQKPWALNYAKDDHKGFNTFVEKASVVVPLSKLPGKKEEPGGREITEATLAVASQMGVSKEDIEKYGVEVNHG